MSLLDGCNKNGQVRNILKIQKFTHPRCSAIRGILPQSILLRKRTFTPFHLLTTYHLEEMDTAINLLEWDRKGTLLELNGRGDDIPVNLEDILAKKKD